MKDIGQFSENLILETIAVFKEEDGLDISPEIANEYLEKLSGLFLAFADKGTSDHLRVAEVPCVALIPFSLKENRAVSDLLTHSLNKIKKK